VRARTQAQNFLKLQSIYSPQNTVVTKQYNGLRHHSHGNVLPVCQVTCCSQLATFVA